MTPYLDTGPLLEAEFLERPNRFIVHYRMGGEVGRAYMANPGKLQEILVPGTTLLLAERPHTKVGVEVVGARWQARWPGDTPRAVFLNTGQVNTLAGTLLRNRLIPELADYEVDRAEVKVGHSRFDFRLRRGDETRLLEVKSVTLVEHGLAMFPDATTDRGRRHVEELMDLSRMGHKTSVLFIVQGNANRFLPDLHNDLEFARTLREASERVELLPYAVPPRYEHTPDGARRLVFDQLPRRLVMPWEDLTEGLVDSGLYLMLLELESPVELSLGRDEPRTFEPGHYIYVGSAKRNLTHRIERHKRKRKGMHYHIDYLRQHASRVQSFPIRGAHAECALAAEVARLGTRIDRFGASDCRCPGHLVYCPTDPVSTGAFQHLLTRWRHAMPTTLRGGETPDQPVSRPISCR
jgi:sugar fermentation stimulation protein A